jgi:hypothetical protein
MYFEYGIYGRATELRGAFRDLENGLNKAMTTNH